MTHPKQATAQDTAINDAMALVESLELPYLVALRDRLNEHIEKRRMAQRLEAVETIRRIAANVGMSVDDLVSGVPNRKTPKGKGMAKYRHPETGRTWSGFGRAPEWIQKAADREAYRVA